MAVSEEELGRPIKQVENVSESVGLHFNKIVYRLIYLGGLVINQEGYSEKIYV